MFVQIVLFIASMIISAKMRKDPPTPNAPTLDDFQVPTASDGKVIPVLLELAKLPPITSSGTAICNRWNIANAKSPSVALSGATTIIYARFRLNAKRLWGFNHGLFLKTQPIVRLP